MRLWTLCAGTSVAGQGSEGVACWWARMCTAATSGMRVCSARRLCGRRVRAPLPDGPPAPSRQFISSLGTVLADPDRRSSRHRRPTRVPSHESVCPRPTPALSSAPPTATACGQLEATALAAAAQGAASQAPRRAREIAVRAAARALQRSARDGHAFIAAGTAAAGARVAAGAARRGRPYRVGCAERAAAQ